MKELYDAACRAESLGHQSAFSEEEHANTAHSSQRASTRQAREQSERNSERFDNNSKYYDDLARQQGARNHAGFKSWCRWHHRDVKDGRAWFEYKKEVADQAAAAPRPTGAGCTYRHKSGNSDTGFYGDSAGTANVSQESWQEWDADHGYHTDGTEYW